MENNKYQTRSSSFSDANETFLPINQIITQSAQLQHVKNKTNIGIFELDPPRQIPKKSYSLQADMINGWKPKRMSKISYNNVFPINFSHELVDQLARTLARTQVKDKSPQYQLAYLGPRPVNSYLLHQNRDYENPYPIDKKIQPIMSERQGIPSTFKIDRTGKLSFNSMFESGNLDLAVQISETQYDLFMRVDTNTKGHTNWFYFQVKNKDFVGPITFNICNFRREKSLYQRGLKPYGKSKFQKKGWKQIDCNIIKYQRKKFRYNFLYEGDQYQQDWPRVCTYFTMTFTYNFQLRQDIVKFAYCVPYTYTDLRNHLKTLSNCKITQAHKTLSGLGVPLVQITDQTIEQYNKQIVLLTARVHPGQSNSSYTAEGFLNFICSQQPIAIQLRKKFCFYVIPMLNPDGVVAGNYRTSWFGKDLNRTYNQKRKYAFPQTFYLLQFVQELKKTGKQRFQIYIDFHGHSVKKNVFMYGPDFSISHQNYQLCRQFPKIISLITPLFRYYSCSFRISTEKTSTARAIFNRNVNIPFTYTMQSSNSSYYDSTLHTQVPFTAQKWKQMGADVARAIYQFALNRNKKTNSNSKLTNSLSLKKNPKTQNNFQSDNQEQQEKNSDDNISEGKSDSQPDSQDLPLDQLKKIQSMIQGKKQYSALEITKQEEPDQKASPEKRIFNIEHFMKKHDYMTCTHRRCRLKRQQQQKRMTNVSSYLEEKALPPIITQNRAAFFVNRRKHSLIQNKRVKNLSVIDFQPNQQTSQSNRVSISQMIMDAKSQILSFQQSQLILKNTQIKKGYHSKKIQLRTNHRY